MSTEPDIPTIAIFDLDGTLSWHDTLAPLLATFLREHPHRLARLWRLPAALLAYARAGGDRGVLKARVVRMVLGGERRAALDAWAQRFVAAMPARGFFRPAALAVLEAHRRAGDRLVLLSASPDLYVPYIGRLLGFHETICSELGWRCERLDGTLRSANRRGAEKLRVLEALRVRYPAHRFVAYGNSGADLAHLRAADRGLLVNAGRGARAAAQRLGIATTEWLR